MAKFNNTITKTKTVVEIDYSKELKNFSGNKLKLLRSIGKKLKSEIKSWSKDQISPVDGKAYKPLSKEYKKLKRKLAGNSKANLVLKDTMLESIQIKTSPTNNIVKLMIKDKKEKLKSFNHNKAKSNAAPLPKRRFLPTAKADKFNNSIMKDVNSLIKDAKDGD